MLIDREPHAPGVTVDVRMGDQPIVIEARDGAVRTELGVAANADATLTGPPMPTMGVLLGLVPLAEAQAQAGVTYEGDPTILERFRSDLTAA
jgi:hypothetical protein